MKRFFSFLVVLVLALSFNILSFAEDQGVKYEWSDYSPIVRDVFSEHSTFWQIDEVDASLWLLDIFHPVDISGEDMNKECIALYSTSDGSAFVALNYLDLSGNSIETLYNYFVQKNYTVEMGTVNDIPVLFQRDIENNVAILFYQTRDNMIFQVCFSPILDDDYTDLFDITIASIRPNTETAEEVTVVSTNPVSGLISR